MTSVRSPMARPAVRRRRASGRATACAAGLLVALVTAPGVAQAPVAAPAPSTGEPWRIIRPPQASLVLARDGSLIGEIGREWRVSVPLASLPAYVPQAFVAVEDQRFYQHDGVDLVGIAGAIKDNLLGASRGASTITQQLVGNMHPDVVDRTDRTIARKLREQAAAREMERRYTKAQILEAYLNQIAFGRGYYGIETAARHYFGKPAARLTLAEAASLAALPKGPALFDPVRHPERNRERRDAVLRLMRTQGYISAAQERAARAQPLRTAPDLGMPAAAPYLVDVVRVRLERAGIRVTEGGYRITTTIDPALQRAAAAALADGLTGIEARGDYRHPRYADRARGSTDYLQGAVVAMEPATGDVRALIGGRNHQESPFNRAVNAVRQPGSSFKPFIYARALLDSLPPTTIIPDTALAVRFDLTVYRPRNSDGAFLGPITMREALAQSRNTVAVRLWERLGADSVIAVARRAGISSPIAPFPSSALGASAVRPIDLVSAYTTFANLGTPVEPRFVLRVEDPSGRAIFSEATQSLVPAMDSAVAYVTRDLMRGVVESGTATAVRRMIPASIPVAGKTGTTDDNSDVWFVGMTPQLVAGVWIGFDRPRPISPGAAGGTLAAPIFGQMLARWGGLAPAVWTPPAGVVTVELDRATGDLADMSTPPNRRYVELFIAGTEPAALRVDARRLLRAAPWVGY
ncbi:MAG: PBP1A family penicillin-binding protein [Gemmatimonadetes bacterium]|nr:PBP1A family penicillin-binding protein [Gemmatimonadota bacterium]